MKQPQPTDTHNTLINGTEWEAGECFKGHSPGSFPPKVLLGRKKEGSGGGWLINELITASTHLVIFLH